MVIDYFDDLELGVCRRINALSRNRAIAHFFAAISRLGDYSAYVIVGLATAITLGSNAQFFMLHAALTSVAGVLLYKALKSRLVRERPFITHGEIVRAAAPLDRYSFPSGHTLHAIGFTVLFGAYAPVTLWIMAPFAALVAASRIILGLHYPSDVLVGGLIGAALAAGSVAVFA